MNEPTVEDCLKELREMFPQFRSRTITFYDPDPGAPYVAIALYFDDEHDAERAFAGATLDEAMSRVRTWHEQQKGSKG